MEGANNKAKEGWEGWVGPKEAGTTYRLSGCTRLHIVGMLCVFVIFCFCFCFVFPRKEREIKKKQLWQFGRKKNVWLCGWQTQDVLTQAPTFSSTAFFGKKEKENRNKSKEGWIKNMV